MNEKNQFPNWMLAAVVIGLAQLTYYLHTRFGFGLAVKSALALTGLAAVFCLTLYVKRLRQQKAKKQ